ncbi:LysR family transcriptional regulator [Phycicoccus endophyticus]|uniref:LysR family transcriptional regulator n=1 Tax=Phycicoccus endophyticus TaxID=1690220 RepID=A0A7G9QYU9_9MICO|nr:LysR family transcriptional regulator [Phycicoccus endophyticus]NHI20430.1 LysR family transcriptional regulator [Phycicoccus endophyticus]QNN48524.1 LysR family transcriptional regulator [Phycicoccus endophyticus]GGL30896.1 LysR family transcriptional regulator [Phycicoccus endophyticus]
MDTDALRWFQLVADGYTVTEVGAIFGVSQPGVSRALARLEGEVGTALLHRHGRVLRMTHAGTAFKRHVDPLVNHLDDGLAAVGEIVDPESGVVTLAYPLSLGSWLVPALVGAFRREHPRVRVALERTAAGEDGRISAQLATRRADLELTAARVVGQGVAWQRILLEPLVLAVGTNHPLAGRESVSVAEVAGEPFVLRAPPSGMREQTLALCRAAGFEPEVGTEAEDLPTIRGFVAAGLGVSVVPAQGLRVPTTFARTRLLPLTDDGAHREVGLAWVQGRPLLPSAEAFRRFVLRSGTDALE